MVEQCQHERLCFDSGGHYVRCLDCGVNWVAIKNAHTSDQDIDYTRGASGLFAHDQRIKP